MEINFSLDFVKFQFEKIFENDLNTELKTDSQVNLDDYMIWQ